MSSIGARSLLVSCQPHQRGILFFIAVEFDGRAVVAHFGKGEADVSLLFLGDGAAQLLHLVINVSAEARHDFPFCSVQIGCAHVVVDAGDAPRVAFLVVGVEERTGLRARYHGRVQHHIPFPSAQFKHHVGLHDASTGRLSHSECQRNVRSRRIIGCILLGS